MAVAVSATILAAKPAAIIVAGCVYQSKKDTLHKQGHLVIVEI